MLKNFLPIKEMENKETQKQPTATLYYTSGKTESVTPQNGKIFTLKELQDFVGGWIEVGYLDDGRLMVVNEEGKVNNLPYNSRATEIYQEHVYRGDVILGNAVVMDAELME